jgi:hypothetical protein
MMTGPAYLLAQDSVKGKLLGTWRLISIEAKKSSGEVAYWPFGKDPVGIIMYDKGRMCAQLMRPGRPAIGSHSPKDITVAFDGYIAYCGTYTIDEKEGTVTHHATMSLIPEWVGGDQKRFYQFSGRFLVLKTPPILDAGQTLVSWITWERDD